jgi:hypothetical protein
MREPFPRQSIDYDSTWAWAVVFGVRTLMHAPLRLRDVSHGQNRTSRVNHGAANAWEIAWRLSAKVVATNVQPTVANGV